MDKDPRTITYFPSGPNGAHIKIECGDNDPVAMLVALARQHTEWLRATRDENPTPPPPTKGSE